MDSKQSVITIPEDIFIYRILPFISSKQTLCDFSTTCKAFRKIVFSKFATECWIYEPYTICIDTFCTQCSRKKPSIDAAFRLLKQCPIRILNLHCFASDIPQCFEALAELSVLQHLELTVGNKTESISLNSIFQDTKSYDKIGELKSFTLATPYEMRLGLDTFSKMLLCTGNSLSALSLQAQHPKGLYELVLQQCPSLQHFRLHRSQGIEDFKMFSTSLLHTLELHRVCFLPQEFVGFVNLKRLLITTFRYFEKEAYTKFIRGFCKPLSFLSLEVPGDIVNEVIIELSKHAQSLTALELHGNYEAGTITLKSMLALTALNLRSLNFVTKKSINQLKLDKKCLFEIYKFTDLETLHVNYDPQILKCLVYGVSKSLSLKHVFIHTRLQQLGSKCTPSSLEHYLNENGTSLSSEGMPICHAKFTVLEIKNTEYRLEEV